MACGAREAGDAGSAVVLLVVVRYGGVVVVGRYHRGVPLGDR